MGKRGKFPLAFVAQIAISNATAYRFVGPNGELRPDDMREFEIGGGVGEKALRHGPHHLHRNDVNS